MVYEKVFVGMEKEIRNGFELGEERLFNLGVVRLRSYFGLALSFFLVWPQELTLKVTVEEQTNAC